MANEYPLSVIIRAVDKISVPMRKISASMEAVSARVRKLNADMATGASALGINRLSGQFNNLTSALGRAGAAGRQLFTRLALIGGISVYAFKSQFIDTASDYENLTTSLTTLEGSAEKAGQSLQFINGLAVKTPFNLNEIADTYRTMKGFGMDGQDGSLWAMTEAMSALGKKGYDLQAVAVQLGQAWGKTKLQVQDIKPMIERGIPVWDLLQKASERAGKKLTIAQLQSMSSSGQLGRKAITGLLEQMAITYEGGNKRMMMTWTGMISNLQDYWQGFMRTIAASGLFDYMRAKLRMILDWIDKMAANGNLKRWAKEISDSIIAMFESIWNARHDIINTLKSIRNGFMWVKDTVGGAKNMFILLGLIMAGSFISAVVNLTIALGAMAWALRGIAINGIAMLLAPFAVFVKALWAGFTATEALSLALWSCPITWVAALFVAAAVSVAYLTYKIWENWEVLKKFFWALGVLAMGGLGDVVSWLGGLLDGIVDAFTSKLTQLFSWFERKYDSIKGLVRSINPFADGAPQQSGFAGQPPGASIPTQYFTPMPSKQTEAKVTVDFTNLPAGARVMQDPRNTAQLDTSMGYSMQTGGGY